MGTSTSVTKNREKEKNLKKLLDNINSLYLLKKLFSQLNEKKKLKTIKYNKKLQKKIDISLSNYRLFSLRYIKFQEYGEEYDYYHYLEFKDLREEKNGKKKEYDKGELIFEGEYLRGKRNGKGKEYYLSPFAKFGIYKDLEYSEYKKWKETEKEYLLKFEGQYLNGKKWNGKGFDQKGNIIYILKNGNGKVKEYDYNGVLEFEGELINGERNGNGKEYYDDGKLKFEGEYLNGKIWNGKGVDRNGNILYIVKDGKGKVKEYFRNGVLKFEGEYLNGEKNGKGKEYDKEGDLDFEGEYLNGKRNGKEYFSKHELFFEGDSLY